MAWDTVTRMANIYERCILFSFTEGNRNSAVQTRDTATERFLI